MKILISNSSDQSLYQQIKDQLKDAILQGELKDGDNMPSIRHFANDLGVSVLTIPEGCITGFISANGAGKTTVLRAIPGLLHPNEGEIRLFGEP